MVFPSGLKIYAILGIIVALIGAATGVVAYFSYVADLRATSAKQAVELSQQEAELDNRDRVIQEYGKGWANANDQLEVLGIDLKNARSGKTKAAHKAAKHDYKKIAKRNPQLFLDIANRNGKRLRDEIRSAANSPDTGDTVSGEATTPSP